MANKVTGLLDQKIRAVSTNTLDGKMRIKVWNKWFVECDDPYKTFGTPQVHKVKP